MGRPAIDLTGQRFGALVVVGRADDTRDKKARWICKCECGATKIIRSAVLRRGIKSCGCMTHDILSRMATERCTTHGLSKHRLESILYGMHRRCENKSDWAYKYYGARGVYVCDEWKGIAPFYEWAINNGYKDGLEIDRIDNNGPYAPWNCRWVTSEENHQNTSANKRVICTDSETGDTTEYGSIRQASRATGIAAATITRMLKGKRTYKHRYNFTPIDGKEMSRPAYR